MTILEHPEAVALLNDAVVSPEQLEEFGQRLIPFLERYTPLFQRSEQRAHAMTILQGKISSLSRKTSEPIAHAFGVKREQLQDFVGSSPWRDRPLRDALRQHVAEAWADPNGVLTGDGCDFPKKGDESCGVKRQHCGRLGKTENCQAGIFLGYSCRRGHTLLDADLFLPKEWADDKERRAKAKIPEDVVYRERWQILLNQIDTNKDVPHSWFTCDGEFGRVNEFREGLRSRNERYVVDVRADLRLRDLRAAPPPRQGQTGRIPAQPPEIHAQEWAEQQPASAWKRIIIREGEKFPLVVEAAETWVETFEASRVGPVERFCVFRTVNNPESRTWYTLSNADAAIPLAQVAWAHGERHWHEASNKEGKSEVGLGHYEVRSWVGWHHHMTLSLLALWFLALERSEGQKKTPALTPSVLREVLSRLLVLRCLTLAGIAREVNATLRRKEEARIYHYYHRTGRYPPRRTETNTGPVAQSS